MLPPASRHGTTCIHHARFAPQNGDVDKAEELKKKLEEKQRAKRKDNGGGGVKPAFFTQEGDGWKYNGQYCESDFCLVWRVPETQYSRLEMFTDAARTQKSRSGRRRSLKIRISS